MTRARTIERIAISLCWQELNVAPRLRFLDRHTDTQCISPEMHCWPLADTRIADPLRSTGRDPPPRETLWKPAQFERGGGFWQSAYPLDLVQRPPGWCPTPFGHEAGSYSLPFRSRG